MSRSTTPAYWEQTPAETDRHCVVRAYYRKRSRLSRPIWDGGAAIFCTLTATPLDPSTLSNHSYLERLPVEEAVQGTLTPFLLISYRSAI